MNTVLQQVKEELNEILIKFDIDENIQISVSKIPNFDIQINNLVKYQEHKSIKAIKKEFLKKIENTNYFSSAQFGEKLFINLKFNHFNCVNNITNLKEDFTNNNPEKIILDYGGPNIGKPLHVGHLRSLNIGRSLYNMNKFIGNNVSSDIHLGDWGMPVAQIISYIDTKEIDINSLEVGDLESIYPISSNEYQSNKKFKEYAKETNKKLNDGVEEVVLKWKIIKDLSINSIKESLEKLDHDFDYWLGESDVNDLIPDMLENLLKNKKIEHDDDALVSTENTDPKILITKSDGSYLYITTDLATIISRQRNIPSDKIFYIVDSRQSLHFKQLFSSAEYFEFDKLNYHHIGFGTLNDENGNPFKTREGGTKPLLELFNETYDYIFKINKDLDKKSIRILTNTVLTYSDLLTNRKTNYKFDLKKFTNVSGKTGIYVQYSQVRAKNLLNSFKDKGSNEISTNISKIESDLLSKLFLFQHYLERSIELSEPHHLADYLYEISHLFNIFYEDEKIINISDKENQKSKLFITKFFLNTCHNIMYCLGIEPVDKM